MEEQLNLLENTKAIVAAFVTKNIVTSTELPPLIRRVHATLAVLGQPIEDAMAQAQAPAVSIRKSVGADYIVCLEDGQKFKSLTRHLKSRYGMTPHDYRAKWKLPDDYPMVAPAY